MEIKIDNELRDLLPPLAQDEIKQLESNLLNDGWEDSQRIILWNGFIIDGHNRYSICQKHNIKFQTEEKQFKNKNEVKLWMIDNQKGRRNLTDGWKWELSQNKKKILEAKHEQDRVAARVSTIDTPKPESGKTQKALAKELGWSTGKVAEADIVWKEAEEKEKEEVKKGNKTIHQVYSEIKKKKKQTKLRQQLKNQIKEVSNVKRDKLKVLNLFSGIGGNRKLWNNVEVTAVESDPQIAEIYKDNFPNDEVIVGDAYEYLLKHFEEFDFIWASPPCQTHSRMNLLHKAQGKGVRLPDGNLFSLIIFLDHYFKGDWIVENVVSYYKPVLNPQTSANHYFWSNKEIPFIEDCDRGTIRKPIEYVSENVGFDLKRYDLNQKDERQYLNNCVTPEVGLILFESILKNSDAELDNSPLDIKKLAVDTPEPVKTHSYNEPVVLMKQLNSRRQQWN